MKLNYTLLFLFIIPLLSFSTHKYYLSLTQIEFNPKSKSIQIIISVFIDDIELAINKDYHINSQLNTKKEVVGADNFFYKYLKENLQVKVDHVTKQFNFIGKEYEGDIVYFYIEINNIPSLTSIDIKNTVLTKYFKDQQNLIKANANGKYNSKILTIKNDKGLLKF